MATSPQELRQMAEENLKAKRYDEALQNLRQALEISESSQNQKEIATTLVALGDASLQAGKGQQALEYYQQAETTARQHGETAALGQALRGLGNIAQSSFKNEETIRYYFQALDVLGDSEGSSTVIVTLFHFGQYLESQDQLEQARAIYQRLLNSNILDSSTRATILLSLGRVELVQNKPEETIVLAQNALQLANSLNESEDHGEKAFALTLIGRAAFSQGKRDEAYDYLTQAMAEYRRKGDEPGLAGIYRIRAQFAATEQNHTAARQDYLEALTIYQLTGSRREEADTAMALAAVETVLGDRGEAAKYVKRARAVYYELGDEATALRAGELLRQMEVAAAGDSMEQLDQKSPQPHPQQSGATSALDFSPSAQNALGWADRCRLELHQSEIPSQYLLAALCQESHSAAYAFLSAFGLDTSRVTEELLGVQPNSEVISRISKEARSLSNSDIGNLPLSKALQAVLDAARQIAESKGSSRIRLRHLFAGLLNTSHASAAEWLNTTLSTEIVDWIKRTLSEWDEAESSRAEAVQQRAVRAGLYIAPTGVRDNAADTDLLGFATHADALASIILRDETKPPLVVGVYGPWGSGKSTFMQLVKKSLKQRATLVGTADQLTRRQRLAEFFKGIPAFFSKTVSALFKKKPAVTPRPELIIVEYDAWAYADAPKLWAGLVAQIAKELDAQLGFKGRLSYLVKFRVKQLRNALLWGLVPVAVYLGGLLWNEFARTVLQSTFIADGLTLISTAFWGIKLFQAQQQPVSASIEALTAKFGTEPMSGVVHSIQGEVKNALSTKFPQPKPEDSARRETTQSDITQRIRENKLKIVVLIDELDRCPLERVVDILEAIKLFLSEEIFIVLMAIDTRVAAEAIRLHYKDVKNPDLPREYLEKIVQLPLQVPRAGDAALKVYLENHMPTTADVLKRTRDKEQAGKISTPTPVPPPPVPVPIPLPHPEPPVVRRADSISSRPKFSDTLTEFNQIAILAEKFLESNPRRIKRLLNTYRYVKMLANAQKEPVDSEEWQKGTLAWLAFTMRWPAFMETTYSAHAVLGEKHKGSVNLLLDALSNDQGEYEKPDVQEIDEYLKIDIERLKRLYETAGNFLIEIPMGAPENQKKEANGEKPGKELEQRVEAPGNV